MKPLLALIVILLLLTWLFPYCSYSTYQSRGFHWILAAQKIDFARMGLFDLCIVVSGAFGVYLTRK